MIEKSNIPVYILCGGKSTRMQTDKGLVDFKGKPFIQWVIDAAKGISDSIFLVTNNLDYADFGYPLINDIYKDKGPVGGIFSALKHSTENQILILSCDVPNISAEILEHYLLKKIEDDADVIMLADNEKIYPLIGIYSKSVMGGFERAIKRDKLKLILVIKDFIFKTIQVAGKHKNALANINTKKELEALENNNKPINITLKYFGEIAEITSCHDEQLVLESTSFSDFMNNLNQKYALKEHDIIVAINHERIDDFDGMTLNNNDEIAILPPFAGG